MTNEEIKKYVEEQLEYHMDEFNLSKEEVEESVMINIIHEYETGKLCREELLKCGEYLGYELDINAIDKAYAERMANRKRRQQSRNKKKGAKLC